MNEVFGALTAAAICDIPHRRVLLFGSRISGRARATSDLDILVETDVQLTSKQKRAIRDRTRAEFGIAADVVCVPDAQQFIQFMVVEHYREVCND